MSIKLGTQAIKVPYSKVYVGDSLVYSSGGKAYTELEYIQSSQGGFSSGLSMPNGFKTKFKVELCVKPSSSAGYMFLLGAEEGTSPYNENFVRCRYNTWQVASSGATFTTDIFTPYEVEASTVKGDVYLKINEQTLIQTTIYGTRTSKTLGILTRNNGAETLNRLGYFKLYYMQIYDHNDNLVADYIPVLDGNGVPCFFDKVTETFFYNETSAGHFYPSETSTYKLLDYIEGTGTQYIDLKTTATPDTRIRVDFTLTQRVAQNGIFGVIKTDQLGFASYQNGSNYFSYYYSDNRGTAVNSQISTALTSVWRMQMYGNSKTYTLLKDTAEATQKTLGSATQSTTLNVYLFTYNTGSTPGTGAISKMRVYYCEMREGADTILRRLIPAKRKSDNKIGMYDLENNEWYFSETADEFLSS